MPVSMQQVRAFLDTEEPNYLKASQLGSGALPHIIKLLKEADPLLASKATYLASLISDIGSEAILKEAAKSTYPEVRIAAAAGARNLNSQAASDILLGLLDDQDIGVRKVALKSAPIDATPSLLAKIQLMKTSDQENFIRNLSSQVFDELLLNKP